MSLGIDPFEVKSEDLIKEITGTITYADGETVQFRMDSEGARRWGNSVAVVGRAVLPCEEMYNAVSTEELWEE